MTEGQEWAALGRMIAGRREALMSRRAAGRASGVGEQTWRRLEEGQPVSARSLYRMLRALRYTLEEQRECFESVGLEFNEGAFEEPETLEQLRAVVGQMRRTSDEAAAVLARLEVEERERR